MPHPAAGLVEDIARVRSAQDRELARLGRGPTVDQQREMAAFAAQHRELFADLEMTVPAPRGAASPAISNAMPARSSPLFAWP
jgi:hypothetical protein